MRQMLPEKIGWGILGKSRQEAVATSNILVLAEKSSVLPLSDSPVSRTNSPPQWKSFDPHSSNAHTCGRNLPRGKDGWVFAMSSLQGCPIKDSDWVSYPSEPNVYWTKLFGLGTNILKEIAASHVKQNIPGKTNFWSFWRLQNIQRLFASLDQVSIQAWTPLWHALLAELKCCKSTKVSNDPLVERNQSFSMRPCKVRGAESSDMVHFSLIFVCKKTMSFFSTFWVNRVWRWDIFQVLGGTNNFVRVDPRRVENSTEGDSKAPLSVQIWQTRGISCGSPFIRWQGFKFLEPTLRKSFEVFVGILHTICV